MFDFAITVIFTYTAVESVGALNNEEVKTRLKTKIWRVQLFLHSAATASDLEGNILTSTTINISPTAHLYMLLYVPQSDSGKKQEKSTACQEMSFTLLVAPSWQFYDNFRIQFGCNTLFDWFGCGAPHQNKTAMPREALYIITQWLDNRQMICFKKVHLHTSDAKQI